jgi:peptidoglycan/xylan/chitin deacetylase (PgdA/CDA1 family)
MKGSERIRKVFHKLKRQFKPGEAVILMYHRITDLNSDPFHLAVSPAHFAQHLEYIQHTCRPMRLLDLVEAVQHGSLPPRTVVITFDDGYVDNLSQACPLLESAQIPWALFVTTSGIDSQREFWWDALEQVLLSSNNLPDRLQLCIQGQEYEWPTTTREQRQLACYAIHKLIQPLTEVEHDQILTNLAKWAEQEQVRRPEYRSMTAAELIQLARNEFVQVGAHTITHPLLSSLSPDEQYNEIVGSRQKLETTLGYPIHALSYPYGDFNNKTAGIVAAAGFRAALTIIPNRIEAGDDPFLLGRFEVNNWGINEFKHQLETFFTTRIVS